MVYLQPKHVGLLTLVGAMFPTLLCAQDGKTAEWGDLKGKFVFVGAAPKPRPVGGAAVVAGCPPARDESLLIGKGNGVANVLIYALGDPKDPTKPVKSIHKDYEKLKGAKVKIDNLGCEFTPHLAILWTSQTLELGNADAIPHNTFGAPFNSPAFNPLIAAGKSVEIKISAAEKLPVSVACSIHPWMKGYLVVRPDPYVAASGPDGTFVIKNLPAGEHTFQIWQEKMLYLTTLTVKGTATKGAKGLYPLKIAKGTNDLGEIKIDAKDYAAKLK